MVRAFIQIDVEIARRLFSYNPETGVVVRKSRKGGFSAGTLNSRGYIQVACEGQLVQAHRLAWVLHHGVNPGELDHINGAGTDNRLANLRECTRSQNSHNTRKKRSAKGSRFKGVSLLRVKGYTYWRAEIRVDGVVHRLGLFKDEEAAGAAYAEASKLLLGEFSRATEPGR